MFDRLKRALFPPKHPPAPAPSPPPPSPAQAGRAGAEDGAGSASADPAEDEAPARPARRRRHTRAERAALLDAFAGSVLTPHEFAEASFRKIFTDDVDVSHVFSEQYLLVIAKASSLDSKKNSTSIESDIQSRLFSDGYPSKSLMDSEVELPISGRYWVWGCATKGVCFLFHRSRLEPSATAPLGCIDMNPFKQGRYLSGLGYQVQTPEYLYEHAQPGDLVIVSNSTYQPEIEALLSSHVDGSLRVVSL